MMNEKTVSNEQVIEVFKTDDGYLHHEISEGWYLDDGVRNYSYTNDVFSAYDFPDYDKDIPKYIGVTHDEEIKTREQMCDVLKGEFVMVKIKTVTSTQWEEIK